MLQMYTTTLPLRIVSMSAKLFSILIYREIYSISLYLISRYDFCKIKYQFQNVMHLSNKITLADLIKIRLPLLRDTIIISAEMAVSVTLRYQLSSIIPVWLGNKHRSYSYVGKIYTARRIIYHLARRG